MMTNDRVRSISGSIPSAVCLATALLAGWAGPASAGVIDSWQGAGVEVFAADRSEATRGATASAAVDRRVDVPFLVEGGSTRFLWAGGQASAEATGRPDGLLSIRSSYKATNPGSRPYFEQSFPEVRASASWSGDAVSVVPAGGGPAPEGIRLGFALDFDFKDWSDYGNSGAGSFGLDINGKSINKSVSFDPYHELPQYRYNGMAPRARLASPEFDSLSFVDGELLRGQATFHLDLPIGPDGTSDPFALLLESRPFGRPESNIGREVFHDLTLSLVDVTLPDGTDATEAGYRVTFDSGMPWPQPVPEPMPVLAWGLLSATLAAWRLTRRRAESSIRVEGR